MSTPHATGRRSESARARAGTTRPASQRWRFLLAAAAVVVVIAVAWPALRPRSEVARDPDGLPGPLGGQLLEILERVGQGSVSTGAPR